MLMQDCIRYSLPEQIRLSILVPTQGCVGYFLRRQSCLRAELPTHIGLRINDAYAGLRMPAGA